ncbi:MAG: ribosome small subunit-dependent GTPase A [Acidimicrobiia bacterium]|nr:ribosome small subunit-dependent GTPase A [Acidimicrobiia bacterium]
MTPLEALGADQQWRELAQSQGGRLGRVVQVDRGECEVMTDEGQIRVSSDSQRAQGDVAPVTGDWITVVPDLDDIPTVEQVLERRTLVVRRDPAEHARAQTLVANVDVVGVVHGLDRRINPAQLERFCVVAWQSGASVAIILAKADLRRRPERDAEKAAALAPGATVVVTAALRGEGLDQMTALLEGNRTLALLGPSGVGKSTLINALVGSEVQTTQEVRAGDARGRHTTIARRLIALPNGGSIVDTPGIRAVGPWDAWEGLAAAYAEIDALDQECRFAEDCWHQGQPGCAVAGNVDPGRLRRYLELANELADQDLDLARRRHE